MSWSLHRWTWALEAPLFVGMSPAGSLNRCRLYVPARAIWGAVTAELAQRQEKGFPDYQALGTRLREGARFTYLYPAEKDGDTWRAWLPTYEERAGLLWRREDRTDARHDLDDRAMRTRLLGTRPATAVDPSSDTAAEGSLRETECLNTHWRKEDGSAGSPLALVGYAFLNVASDPPPNLDPVEELAIGGDTRYGLGRLKLKGVLWIESESSKIFGFATKLGGSDPSVESDRVLGHAEGIDLFGQREALGGWDYGSRGVQHVAGALWVPGSRLERIHEWSVRPTGLWRAAEASETPPRR